MWIHWNMPSMFQKPVPIRWTLYELLSPYSIRILLEQPQDLTYAGFPDRTTRPSDKHTNWRPQRCRDICIPSGTKRLESIAQRSNLTPSSWKSTVMFLELAYDSKTLPLRISMRWRRDLCSRLRRQNSLPHLLSMHACLWLLQDRRNEQVLLQRRERLP